MIMKSPILSAADICALRQSTHSYPRAPVEADLKGQLVREMHFDMKYWCHGHLLESQRRAHKQKAGSFGEGKKNLNDRVEAGNFHRRGGGGIHWVRVTECSSWRDEIWLWRSTVDEASQGRSFGPGCDPVTRTGRWLHIHKILLITICRRDHLPQRRMNTTVLQSIVTK